MTEDHKGRKEITRNVPHLSGLLPSDCATQYSTLPGVGGLARPCTPHTIHGDHMDMKLTLNRINGKP